MCYHNQFLLIYSSFVQVKMVMETQLVARRTILRCFGLLKTDLPVTVPTDRHMDGWTDRAKEQQPGLELEMILPWMDC